jgi:uncharacterized membrane protein
MWLRLSRLSPEWVFLTCALTFGAISIVAMPPLIVHDEWAHFLRAYDLSRGRLRPVGFEQGWPVSRVPVPFRSLAEQIGPIAAKQKKVSFDTLRELWSIPLQRKRGVAVTQWGTVPNSPVAYLPSALGIVLARRAGLGPLGILYGARFASLLSCVALIFAAIRTLPFLKPAMTALALFPACISLYASCSGDAPLLASSWLMIALVFNCSTRTGPLGARVTAAVGILGMTAGLCKLPYISLGLLGFLLPVRRRWWRGGLLLAFVSVPAFVWSAYARGLVPAVHSIPGYRCAPADQLDFLRAEPLSFCWIIVDNIIQQSYVFFSHLPELACQVEAPCFAVLAGSALFLFVLAALEGDPEGSWPTAPSVRDRILCGLTVAAGVFMIYVCMYLWWSEVRGRSVAGVTPRYFLPLLPLLLIGLRGTLRRAWIGNDRAVVLVMVASPAVLFVEYARLLNQYYRGCDTRLLGSSAVTLMVAAVAGLALWSSRRALDAVCHVSAAVPRALDSHHFGNGWRTRTGHRSGQASPGDGRSREQ